MEPVAIIILANVSFPCFLSMSSHHDLEEVKIEWRQLYNDQPANVADKVQVPDTRRAGASHGRSSQVQVLSLCQILRKPWSTLNLRIGDPVWAKMKGFSPWPGKVCLPPTDCKRPAGGVTYSLIKEAAC